VSFPDTIPSLVTNLGPLALNYVLLEGGSGYFRMNTVRPHLESGALYLVPGAPHFSFPIYAVHSANVDIDSLDAALTVLRAVSKIEVKNHE
jgi:LysR family transcriptional regulator, flagellar master operon regulator